MDKLPKSSMDNPFNPLPQILDQPTAQIGNIGKCVQWNGQQCKTIRYCMEYTPTLEENKTLSKFMGYVIQESKLDSSEFEFMQSEKDLVSFIDSTPNVTTNGLVLSSISVSLYNYTIYHNATYDLLTLITPGRKPDNRNELQVVVDRAIFRYHQDTYLSNRSSSDTGPYLKYQSRLFPQLGFKGGQSVVDDKGSVFFYCGIMVQSIILLYNICQEKDLKLRQGLKVIGLSDSAYWTSVLIYGVCLSILSILVLISSGFAFEIRLFTHTNLLVTFTIYFVFSLAAISLVLFSSIFIEKAKASLNAGMLHFILGLLLVSIMSKSQTKEALNDPDTVWPWVPQLLSFLFPAYNLGEALGEIDYYVNSNKTDFTWGMLYEQRFKLRPIERNATVIIEKVPLPTTNDSLLKLILNFFVFGLVGLYLDQVIRGTHGEPRKWWFLLDWKYWIGSQKQHHLEEVKMVNNMKEQEQHLLTENHTPLLQVLNLRKKFVSKNFKGDIVSVNNALDGVSLYGQENQVLAVLGHNGAGKSTMINVITGLLSSDSGDVYVNDLSVRTNMESVRKIIGVCPQHDILWNELTAEEHIYLLAMLKQVPSENIKEIANKLLSDVDLLGVSKKPVGTFSGGMKRRLSVSLSFLGDPKLVILDEPTSGMDPYIRRDIWNLILGMRKGRSIVMTTHSMQEADILGDYTVIMSNGRVETEGTNIELKNKYAGYRLVASSAYPKSVMDIVDAFIDNAELVSEKKNGNGGYDLVISLPSHCDDQFICLLDAIEKENNIFQSFSVSQTSLEDVFLRVTAEAETTNQQTID